MAGPIDTANKSIRSNDVNQLTSFRLSAYYIFDASAAVRPLTRITSDTVSLDLVELFQRT